MNDMNGYKFLGVIAGICLISLAIAAAWLRWMR